MSIADDTCNFATFRPATLTVTNFFKQVWLSQLSTRMLHLFEPNLLSIITNMMRSNDTTSERHYWRNIEAQIAVNENFVMFSFRRGTD